MSAILITAINKEIKRLNQVNCKSQTTINAILKAEEAIKSGDERKMLNAVDLLKNLV